MYNFRIEIRDHTEQNIIIKDLPHQDGAMFTYTISRSGGQQSLDTWSVPLIPAWQSKIHLKLIYNKLDFYQRAFYYDRGNGKLLFIGIILQIPTGILSTMISGECKQHYLTRRLLGHSQLFQGSMQLSLEYLVKLWESQYKEDFNLSYGDLLLKGWTPTEGQWIIDNETLKPNLLDNIIYYEYQTSTELMMWQINAIGFSSISDSEFSLSQLTMGGDKKWGVSVSHLPNESGHNCRVFIQNGDTPQEFEQRWAAPFHLPEDTKLEIQVWIIPFGGGAGQIQLWVNGVNFIELNVPDIITSGPARMQIESDAGTAFDNLVIFEKKPQYTLDLSSIFSSNQVDQEFDEDSFLDAVKFFADQFDLEWVIDYSTTPTTFRIRDANQLGSDLSQSVIFERGNNLINLVVESSAQEISTSVSIDGKGQGFSQTLAREWDSDAVDKYGWIETIISDGRVSDNELAQNKASNYLRNVKDGIQSMNAVILETNQTYQKWGVGDYVWVRDEFQNINTVARVIKITYKENNPQLDVIFGRLKFSKSAQNRLNKEDIRRINSGGKGDNTDHTFRVLKRTLLIDDYDSKWFYQEDALANDTPPISFWQSFSGQVATGTILGTLHYNNLGDSFAQLTFFGSGIRIYIRRDDNIATHRVQITDSETPIDEDVGGWTSGGRQDKYLLYKIPDVGTELQSEKHTLTISRGEDLDLDRYINIDAVYLRGWFEEIFIEMRAVSKAIVSWNISNPNVEILILVDGEDITENIGGPFTGSQDNINLMHSLSRPGYHSIEFVNNSWDSVPSVPSIVDVTLEATITISGLI